MGILIFLISTKFIINKIDVSGYGYYTFFSSLIGTFSILDGGLILAVSKYLSEYFKKGNFEESNQVISFAFAFYIVLGFSIIILINIFNSTLISILNIDQKYAEINGAVLFICTLIFTINLLNSVFISILTSLEKWKTISLINILSKLLSAVFLIFVVYHVESVLSKIKYIFISLLIISILKCIVYYLFSKIYFKEIKIVYPEQKIRTVLFAFLKQSSIQYLLSLFLGHFDKFIVTKYFGIKAMGVFGFVTNSFIYIYGFLVNGFKIFFPKMSQFHGDMLLDLLKNYFMKLLKYSFYASIIISATSMLAWKTLITLYIDSDFAEKSWYFFSLYSLLLIFRSPEPIFHMLFNAIAKPAILVQNLVILAPTTILGYFLFVPLIGAGGLILASIVGNIVVYSYNYHFIRKIMLNNI